MGETAPASVPYMYGSDHQGPQLPILGKLSGVSMSEFQSWSIAVDLTSTLAFSKPWFPHVEAHPFQLSDVTGTVPLTYSAQSQGRSCLDTVLRCIYPSNGLAKDSLKV